MDLIKIRKELNDIGFAVIPFPQSLKKPMIHYIKTYLSEIVTKQSDFSTMKKENSYENNSASILSMPDIEYIQYFSKPFRIYPDHLSHLIINWIKIEMCRLFEVHRVDANYVSPAERKINQKLHPTTYDIFWRCVRLNKNDVGHAHCDCHFWDLAKGTEGEVSTPFPYRERWKLWVPLMGCAKDNVLQVIPYSHQEHIPMHVIDTAFGKRPSLDPVWYEKNEKNFIFPDVHLEEECIIFHDRLVHRGPKNRTSNLRISSELTMVI